LYFHPTIPVIVISWDLTPAQEAYLSRFATVVPRREDLPDDPTWGRLGLFHTGVCRAIYLDADTIILRSIDELLSCEAPFAAAPNLDWCVRENFSDLGVLHECGVNPDLPAFNAGVLVVDVPYWGTRLYDELLDLERTYGESFLLGDQSALHLAFNRSPYPFTWLPAEFNAIAEFWDWEHDPDTPRIVHYAGPDKPWHASYGFPMREQFLRWSTIADRCGDGKG
jgi:lipopolysaccharide biosynthesis glycosyltransferase